MVLERASNIQTLLSKKNKNSQQPPHTKKVETDNHKNKQATTINNICSSQHHLVSEEEGLVKWPISSIGSSEVNLLIGSRTIEEITPSVTESSERFPGL